MTCSKVTRGSSTSCNLISRICSSTHCLTPGGSQHESWPTTCNEHVLKVHYNLYTALPYLARRVGEREPLPIWIDAICINQHDEAEKMVQIALMNRIYKRAQTVWVWLGLAQHQNQISRAISLFTQFFKYDPRRPELRQSEPAHDLDDLDPSVWSAMFHIIQND